MGNLTPDLCYIVKISLKIMHFSLDYTPRYMLPYLQYRQRRLTVGFSLTATVIVLPDVSMTAFST